MDCMSVGVGDGSATCEFAAATAAANDVGVVTSNCSVSVPKDIYDRLCGSSMQGKYLSMGAVAAFA